MHKTAGRRTAAAISRLARMTEPPRELSAGHGVDRSDSTPPLGGA